MSRCVETIFPQKDGIGFYCCGPTVYNYAHIGNFRTFIAADFLRRVLILGGYRPNYVRNITDVDDKTIVGAQKDGVSLQQFTRHWEGIFHEDCQALHLLPPDVEPRAAEHIAEQISLIEKLIAKKHAYVRDGSVYFAIGSWDHYGRLSRVDGRELRGSQEIVVAKDAAEDFVLWKAAKESDGEVFWDSPWGRGRPGWHIECSAMALKYLGENFAIHGGGIDLCFPHHENEIAQTEAATGSPIAKHWFHVAHLHIGGEKMSKSLGNLYTLADIRKMGYEPTVLRYTLLAGHYRQSLNFTTESLHAAQKALEQITKFCQKLWKISEFNEKMASEFHRLGDIWEMLLQDLNTPAALGKMFERMHSFSGDTLSSVEATEELGEWRRLLFAFGLEEYCCSPRQPMAEISVPQAIEELAQERLLARKMKNFSRADELRKALKDEGWDVKDSFDGYQLIFRERI